MRLFARTHRTCSALLVSSLLLSPVGCVTIGAQASSDSGAPSASGDSSGQSSEGSAASGESSGASADSSNGSNASSETSFQDSSANSTANSSQGGGQTSLVLSGSGTLLGTVGGIGAIIYAIKVDSDRRASQAKVALLYLRANEAQLAQDLALGAGPTLEDLAGAAHIRSEHRGRFARLLQRNRRDLLALADAERLTPERAVRFLEKVGALVLADPLLREEPAAWIAEAGG